MLTLAFAQIVWAICFKWNDVTGGEQGYPTCPIPSMGWMGALPVLGDFRVGDHFYLSYAGHRGALLCRPAPHRRFAVRPRADRRSATTPSAPSSSASMCAAISSPRSSSPASLPGSPAALFGIFNRGVFPGFRLLAKSAEVADHDDPRRHGRTSGARRSAPPPSSCSTSRSPPTPSTGRSCWAHADRAAVRVSGRHRRHHAGASTLRPRRSQPPSVAERRSAMLEVEGVRKTFDGFVAVDDVSLAVERGRDRRRDRPERRRQVDAVQSDHRAPAARQPAACCSRTATSPARRRTASA